MNTEPDSTSLFVDIQVDDARWLSHFSNLEVRAKEAFIKSIHIVVPHMCNYQACLVFTNDKTIQKLNKTYRHKNQPTNVLSFPADHNIDIDLPVMLLGDIIMAFDTIKREALEQNKTFQEHTIHLIVHGALHLLGYDHVKDDEAEKMESLEIKILAGMGIANPYEDDDV